MARQSILSDPDFHDGFYLKKGTYPRRGLILARMVGHITYITEDAMKAKFGRDLKSGKFMYTATFTKTKATAALCGNISEYAANPTTNAKIGRAHV